MSLPFSPGGSENSQGPQTTTTLVSRIKQVQEISRSEIRRIQSEMTNRIDVDPYGQLGPQAAFALNLRFNSRRNADPNGFGKTYTASSCKDLSKDDFFRVGEILYQEEDVQGSSIEDQYLACITDNALDGGISAAEAAAGQTHQLTENNRPDEQKKKEATQLIQAKWERSTNAEVGAILNKIKAMKPVDPDNFYELLCSHLQVLTVLKAKCREYGIGIIPHAQKRTDKSDESSDRKRPRAQQQDLTSCNACGRHGHSFSECRILKDGHPDCNPDETILFKDSRVGLDWKQKGATAVPGSRLLNGKYFEGNRSSPYKKK